VINTEAPKTPRDRLHAQSRAVVDRWYEIHGSSRDRLSVAEAREATVRCLTAAGPTLPEVRDVDIPSRGGGLRVRLYRPDGPLGTLLFLHGGGWVVGTLDTFDALCRTMALVAGCNVLSVDYRLAPEAPFPAAVDDTYDALVALDRGKVFDQVGPVAVGGISAGGNLAAVVSLLARDKGEPQVAYQLLVVPVCDADLTRGSYVTNAVDLGLEVGEMRWFWNHYCPIVEERSSWRASPFRADDFAGLPPTSIVVADCDPLVDEGVAYAAALHGAGVDVVCSRWSGMHHGFFGNPAIDAGVMSLHAEATRLRRFLGRAS
jgi:acetyl esterase